MTITQAPPAGGPPGGSDGTGRPAWVYDPAAPGAAPRGWDPAAGPARQGRQDGPAPARHARRRTPRATPGPVPPPPPSDADNRPAGGRILIAGAHGGAGATTLAALMSRELGAPQHDNPIPRGMLACLDHATVTQALLDTGGGPDAVYDLRAIPDADPQRIATAGWVPVPPAGVALILAVRGTADGARRAVLAVTALGYRGVRPAAIAVVADGAGPEPRQAAQRFAVLAGRAGPVVRVPFAAVLRTGADPATARLPRRLRAAVADLAALAVHGVPAPGRSW